MSIEDHEARARFFEQPIDPIIHWPSGSPHLGPMLAEMQRLNPTLSLRCATSTYPAYEERYRMDGSAEIQTRTVGSFTSEYLVYHGSNLDVVTIVMPEPPDDEMMSGLTEVTASGPRKKQTLANFVRARAASSARLTARC